MPESFAHQKLKQDAVELLLSRGYDREKIIVDKKYIKVDFYGEQKPFRVDVYASNSHEIAVECGNFPNYRKTLYERYFGRDYVIHLSYPKNYGKTILKIEAEFAPNEAKKFLIQSYSKHIYEQFKDDPIFDFQEFNEQNREVFDIDNHRTYRELNPDWIE